MPDTRERILLEALRLFAKDGYEAVSVSEIAAALGMTKGALYKHYQSKRDIFEQILRRMEQLDAQRAGEYDMPQEAITQGAEAYRQATADRIKSYSEAQFRYWTEEEFPSCFRRMLTLEQYRSPEMSALYQQYLAGGPAGYMEDLFRELLKQPCDLSPRQLALQFYAPLYLLISLYDGSAEKDTLFPLAQEHIRQFFRRLEMKQY